MKPKIRNARIKNSKATSKLELVAEHGKLGILYAIATEIFNVQGSVKKKFEQNYRSSTVAEAVAI
jgi:hypothetical protein